MSIFNQLKQPSAKPFAHFMKKTLPVSLLLVMLASWCFAQKPLTNSRQSSFYTYIYKLDDGGVLNFYKFPGTPPDEKILRHPIDSFKTDCAKYWENHLPAGNYLKVYAEKNKLVYKLIENHTAWLKLMPNDYDLRFVFADNEQLVKPDRVTVDQKNVGYDIKTATWHLGYSKKDTIIQAEWRGVLNVFSVKQRKYYSYRSNNWLKTEWLKIKDKFRRHENRYYQQQNKPHFTGFMVFNKPVYKPHDTVRFKAFVFKTGTKKPIKVPQLLVRLKARYRDNGKIIGKVTSYRDGGYEYSFVLTDSLKLDLDDEYDISLEDPSAAKYDLDKYDGDNEDAFLAKRKVYIQGRFRYEDYELKSIHFSMRADKKEHQPGNPLSVYLKATDENDLPVPDGRVKLVLTTGRVDQYKQQQVFVADTLWQHEMNLDPVGETKLVISDAIFPKASLSYNIHADFLNSSNEHQSAYEYEKYVFDKYTVEANLNADTLIATYREEGKERKAKAIVSAMSNEGDTLSKLKVTLPYKMIINPNVSSYAIETDSADNEIELSKSETGISLSGYRTVDSLFVNVKNERKLHFWYTVFAGNKLLDEGQADGALFYKKGYGHAGNITFLTNYIWGRESKTSQTLVGYADKVLTINVKQPLSVYPGQKAETDIVVTDIKGKPVANTDVTAWSLTKKFENYTAPFVPYLGKSFPQRKTKPAINILKQANEGEMALNWARWGREIGLDSISYYKFTHPTTTYRVEEPDGDSVTQIAPFIVKNGDIVPVHILYIDNRPVYFSQAQQLQRYSFQVTPGIHTLRFRTANQNIAVDTVHVEKSKKLIISFNSDEEVNSQAKFTKFPDTLSVYEADLINKYMISVINNFGDKMAEIVGNNQLFLLNPEIDRYNRNNVILTGPLAENFALFKLRGEADRAFDTEPAYTYLFEPGLIKQKSIATKYPFGTKLKGLPGTDNYKQYVLTQNEADTLWQQYLDLRSNTQTLFKNEPVDDKVTGMLDIGFNDKLKNPHPFIKNIIIYRYDDPDFIRIYPGNTTNFGKLTPGKYRLLFLLKGDSYDMIDSIGIKPFGTNYYRLTIKPSHPKDGVSIQINNIIDHRTGEYSGNDSEIENDALKLKEAFNEKYFDNNTFGDMMSGQVLGYDDKLPVAGCTIKVKGTSFGAVTDINGRFKINVPKSGSLVITFIGYQTKEIYVERGKTVTIYIKPSSNSLNEVVVVGYGSVKKQDISGAVQMVQGQAAGVYISQGAPGAASTVFIRGVATFGNVTPLIIVDGVPVDNMDNIRPSDIAEISVLKDAAATALYGARAANGVIIISTKKKTNIVATDGPSQQNDELSIRKNFSDYAYWQPKLTTDANGKASFTTTFPDDITNWRTFVIAANGQKQTGYVEHQIKSYKPLSATFIAPLFAVQGDELSAIGKVTNYSTDPIKLTRSFTYNGKPLKQDAFEVKNTRIDTLNVTAANTDSLTFEYTIKRANGYFDGERRKIAVVEQGVKETKGIFEALNKDTTVTMQFDPALGPVTFRAEASALPALAEEAQCLRDYKYLCNEQLASKLKGLLAEKRICAYLGQPFKYERNILEVIKKLQENRRSQGTWGWWKDTDEELWISLHAVEALLDAQKEGYTIDIDLSRLTEYLVYQLESYKGEEKLACLQLLHKINAKADYAKYFGVIDKEYAGQKLVSKYNQFRLMLLKQEAGLAVKLDSIFLTGRHTLFGNVYWGEDSYQFFDNAIQISVLAYQIIKNEGKHPELLEKIRGYFLEQRRSGEWRNTYETSLILETILPDLLKKEKTVQPASLVIKGAKADTVTKFPYTATLTDRSVTISKTGALPVYVTGFQQFWNSNPVKASKDFMVDTWFEKNGNKLTQLKGGEQVSLKAEVTAKGDADYIMLEIPIPAGCSYENKEQAWQNNEVHREYFKEKVSIFCRKLKQGKYTFTVNLMPRYSGKYTLNPAKAEMMYFPVFYGMEGMRQVVVGE
jgi:TonB-dependent SusC/RagA subfamily outer membrane receptor